MNDFTLLPVDPVLIAIARKRVEKIEGEDWHGAVRKAQDTLNCLELGQEIARTLTPDLKDILHSKDILIQSNLYLRAARPNMPYDAIDWHRESFYGCQPDAFNIWIPVQGVTPENCMKYIPGSADIPDDAISVEFVGSGAVHKGSDAHKIGLLYAPKRIVGGVDLTRSKPMIVPDNHAAVFSGQLIHGAAQNTTKNVRFSIDFRVIAAEHVGQQKKSFAGDGKDFFVPLRAA